VLVTNFDSASVSVIDRASGRVTATIPVGDGPIGVVASADGSSAYVANFHSATVSVLSVVDREVVDTISVQGSANALALTADGALLYVTDTFGETVAVIDTVTRRVVKTIPAPAQPAGVAVAADGHAFVANFGGTTISVVDAWLGEVVAKIVLDAEVRGPLGIAIAPDAGFGYVTSAFSSALFRIATSSLARTTQIFPGPAEAVAIAPDGSLVYSVATERSTGNGVVRVLDSSTNEIIRTIRVGDTPEAVAVTPDGLRVYAANTGSDTVSFFDDGTGFIFVRSIPVGAAPMGVAIARIASTTTATPEPTATPTMPTPTATPTLTPTPTMTSSPSARPTPTPSSTPGPLCAGDCDRSEEVSLAEIISAIGIALGSQGLSVCPAADADGRGTVTVDEIVAAIRNHMVGCGGAADRASLGEDSKQAPPSRVSRPARAGTRAERRVAR
jgi:YVTN family beta-propeller protein